MDLFIDFHAGVTKRGSNGRSNPMMSCLLVTLLWGNIRKRDWPIVSTSLHSGKRHLLVLFDLPGTDRTAAVLDDNLIAVVHSEEEIPFLLFIQEFILKNRHTFPFKRESSRTSSQFSASLCSKHTYSEHSWRCLPQPGTKRRGEGILRMEGAGTSVEDDDIDSQDSNTPIDHGHLARNCSTKIIPPAVKASVI